MDLPRPKSQTETNLERSNGPRAPASLSAPCSAGGRRDGELPPSPSGVLRRSGLSFPAWLPPLPVALFFLALLVLGIALFRDYGISSDEIVNRNNGLLTWNYVFKGDPALLEYSDRFYGTVFESVLMLAEKALGVTDWRTIFLMRHFLTFLLFYVAVIFFYKLCAYRFADWRWGLVGAAALVLSPRIFGHAFFNSKDIASLAFFVVSTYTLVRFLDDKRATRAVWHALASALVIDVRILGVFIPCLTAGFVLTDLLLKKRERRPGVYRALGLYAVLLPVLTVLFWPILWRHPLANFIEAFRRMSRYPWHGTVLYFGRYVSALELPWHYALVWMLISIPIVYILFFVIGTYPILKRLAAHPFATLRERRAELLLLVEFAVPVAAVIVLGSVLYDGWRHLFFTYPGFLFVALVGLHSTWNSVGNTFRSRRMRTVGHAFVAGVVGVNAACVAWFMVRYHPYQNVYFNAIAGDMRSVRRNFDMDYWGLSYRAGLEYILDHDAGKQIPVFIASLPKELGLLESLILTPRQRARLVFADMPLHARYFLSNYRWHCDDYSFKDEIFSVRIRGGRIMVVYKLSKADFADLDLPEEVRSPKVWRGVAPPEKPGPPQDRPDEVPARPVVIEGRESAH
ncbi:MAG: hypothetical protein GXP31_17380 [Kiritimatiellaeota bacterium]|nr:hypothetical protein [Kiritimatiellota bacterium]